MSRSASLKTWLPVMGLCVGVCFAGLWAFRNGLTALGNVLTLVALVLFAWLFERL